MLAFSLHPSTNPDFITAVGALKQDRQTVSPCLWLSTTSSALAVVNRMFIDLLWIRKSTEICKSSNRVNHHEIKSVSVYIHIFHLWCTEIEQEAGWVDGCWLALKDNLSSQILRWWWTESAAATRLLLSDKVFLCDSSGIRFPSLLTVCKSGMHRICLWNKRSSIDRWR